MSNKLVIVESPTKANTISKFLGKEFHVESSFGHVRDLPESSMGIKIEDGSFEPSYVVPKKQAQRVKKLKELAKKSSEIIFATDKDREGEAISWHLAKLFKINPDSAKRIEFHEITKHAIEEALKNPKNIDINLVNAQQARRILDRLVGYELSPLLWKKIARGLSAGRVQSVALRLIIDRENEIKAFKSQEYWTIDGAFSPEQQNLKFSAKLAEVGEKKLDRLDLANKTEVDKIMEELSGAEYFIKNISKKEIKRTPPPPFTTSTLQQKANAEFGFSSKQTMMIAQQLYEGIKIHNDEHVGLITYMRTDSVNLSDKFLNETKNFIGQQYGKDYVLDSHRRYNNKSKGAQEAHEAIHPTDPENIPEKIKEYLSPQQYKIYSLIWKRAVATQMQEARLNQALIDIQAKKYIFRATGQTMIFNGWLALYPKFSKESILPEMKIKEKVLCKELKPAQHFTEPPSRYSDALLVKALEEYEIGRPSTYAPTIATIEERKYVERDENKKLKPLDIAFTVTGLLVKNFPEIVDYSFTATVENEFDNIAEGKTEWKKMIGDFYAPFHKNLKEKEETIKKEDVMQMRELGADPKTGKPIYARVGRFGPFVQRGSKDDEEKPQFASLKKTQDINTITLEQALELLSLPKTLGQDENGSDIIANVGRFGPYIQVEKKYYSIKDIDPHKITLEEARVIIAQKKDAEAKKEIKVFENDGIKILSGKYGPYVTDGKKNAKISNDKTPEELSLEECKELLSKAKTHRYNRRRIKKT